MNKLLVFVTGFLVLGLNYPSIGAENAAIQQRTISVSGESKKEVAPDRAILWVSLVSKDMNLKVAKQNNDAMVERLVSIARQFEIPKEKIATSNIYMSPQYTYENNEQRFAGYTVTRSLQITMDAQGTHEKLLSAIVEAKVDQVNGIQFDIADPETQAAQLRVKAFENAKARADALAKAAGSKLGPALMISTVGSSLTPPPYPVPMMKQAMMADASNGGAPSLPGMVTLQESVMVTFALE